MKPFARALQAQLNGSDAAAAALPDGGENRGTVLVGDDAAFARELDRVLNGPQGQEIAPVFVPLSDRQTERNSCIASAVLTVAMLVCTIVSQFLF